MPSESVDRVSCVLRLNSERSAHRAATDWGSALWRRTEAAGLATRETERSMIRKAGGRVVGMSRGRGGEGEGETASSRVLLKAGSRALQAPDAAGYESHARFPTPAPAFGHDRPGPLVMNLGHVRRALRTGCGSSFSSEFCRSPSDK